jgi:energy-coupling factor transporter ATP-binding protein EcfA2
MLQRLYVHNFRCLENFEFRPDGESSVLFIGNNGSGKSTIAKALAVLQRIGRSSNRVGELVNPSDFAQGRTDVPMRFELRARLGGRLFDFALALELPDRFKELRVLEESLHVDGVTVYSRNLAQVKLHRGGTAAEAGAGDSEFSIDWHHIALPVIQDRTRTSALELLKRWLDRIVLLAPLPPLMHGEAHDESLRPTMDGSNFTEWLAGLLAQYPAAYSDICEQLQKFMPDLEQFLWLPTGRDAKVLQVEFRRGDQRLHLTFDALSDGEKCFFLGASLLAANRAYGPLLAFWDEPESHLAMAEVRHFAMALRRAFREQGQVFVTSHNEETIRSFSHENTWLLQRKSHLEPSTATRLVDLHPEGDLIHSILTDGLAG